MALPNSAPRASGEELRSSMFWRPKGRLLAGCGAPLGSARQWIKEDERASLRRDADDVVIRFAGILEIAGAQLKPASFWAVSLPDRVYVAASGWPR